LGQAVRLLAEYVPIDRFCTQPFSSAHRGGGGILSS
jgi:hypothetical protein